MTRQVDKEVLIGFVEEAKSYLPEISDGLNLYQADQTHLEGLEIAYRHIHTIKGASSMVGIAGLSQITHLYEECLEKLGASELTLNQNTLAFLTQIPQIIGNFLDHVLSTEFTEQEEVVLIATVTSDYQALNETSPTEPLLDQFLAEEDLQLPIVDENEPVDESPIQESEIHSDLLGALGEKDGPTELELNSQDLRDLISTDLLEPFTIEAEDLINQISLLLTEFAKKPEEKFALEEIQRLIHTLKGGAGTVGFSQIAALSHRMEDLLDQLQNENIPFSSEAMTLLFETADTFEVLLYKSDPIETIPQLYAAYDSLLDSAHSELISPLETQTNDEETLDLSKLLAKLPAAETVQQEVPSLANPQEVVRVPLHQLDELVRSVSELVITRASFEQHVGSMSKISDELFRSFERLRRVSVELETQYEVNALGNQDLFQISTSTSVGGRSHQLLPVKSTTKTGPLDPYANEFDNLQMDRYTHFHLLTRDLTETTSDLRTINDELRQLIGDFDGVANRQRRLSGEIQDKLMRTRMVPLATIATRLHRAVRVVSQKQSKQVSLMLEGENTELDKEVLEEIANPLLHILRNSVDHGIESPAVRLEMGKPERGEISLRTYHKGNQVIIEIEDDGAGLNLELLRRKAVETKLVSEIEVRHLSNDELYSLVFIPGFSTAREVDEVSGRGVGLDVVKSAVNKLKGTISIDSTPGKGVRFTIRLPLTMAVIQALMIKSHEETYAIPLGAVSQIVRVGQDKYDTIGEDKILNINGQVYPLANLSHSLNTGQKTYENQERLPILIVDTGLQQIAVIVDEIIEGREVVVKTLGSHLQKVHGITGATLLGNGRVVLILNPAELVGESVKSQNTIWPIARQANLISDKPLQALVIDDSVSVRRVVSNLIKNAGWHAATAKDGLDALDFLQAANQLPDIILMDIEMPRMDGYELTATLKANDQLRHIPIIMLTSRASDKHRYKAIDLGVDEYMVKPFKDEELLNRVRQLVQVHAPA